MKEWEIKTKQVAFKEEVVGRLDVEPLAEIIGDVSELTPRKARGKEVYTIQS